MWRWIYLVWGAVATLLLVPVILAEPVIGACMLAGLILVFIWRRSAKRNWESPSETDTRSLPVLLLPATVALGTQSAVLSALGLLAIAAYLIATVKRGQGKIHWSFWMLLAGSALVWVRIEDPLALGKAFIVAVIAVLIARSVPPLRIAVSALDGIGLYLAANVIAWAFGLSSPSSTTRVGGYEGGILFADRVLFPLTSSINTVAGVAAIYVLGAVALLLTRRFGWVRLLSVGCALFVLLAAGARLSLVLAVAGAVLILLWPRMAARTAPIVMAIGVSLPLLYPLARPTISLLSDWVAGVSPILQARSGQGSNDSFNGRDFIWSRATDYWQGMPQLQQLVGYGPDGHIGSGASAVYGQLFLRFSTDPTAISPHSSLLQQLFDGGLIGAALLFVAMVGATAAAAHRYFRGDTHALVPLMLLVGIAISAAFESSAVPSGLGEVFVILLIATAALSVTNERKLEKSPLVTGVRLGQAAECSTG